MLLGLLPPDAGTVTLFGMTPDEAIAAGAVGAMLQVGGVIRDLTRARTASRWSASLYPNPLAGGRGHRADRHRRPRRPQDAPSCPAARPSGCASRSRWSATPTCSCWTSRPSRSTSRRAATSGRRCARSPARGKTVVFATHYLEEADAYADRIILMAHGRIVADGPATEIKAHGRAAHDPGDAAGADSRALAALPGVTNVDTRGEAVILNCSDSDAALRALLPAFPAATRHRGHAAPAWKRRSCN